MAAATYAQGTDEPSRTAVVIEDDPDIRDLLGVVLGQAGFTVRTAATGAAGVEAVRAHDPLVTTLDVSLPDIDGFEVCRRLRAFSDTYVVMLTARAEEIDALMGLDAGADDYQTKPFRPRELRARVEALLRRPRRGPAATVGGAVGGADGTGGAGSVRGAEGTDAGTTGAGPAPVAPAPGGPGAGADVLRTDGLVVDVPARLVAVDGADVHLTRSEFDLLAALATSAGRVVSKTELVRVLWGEDYDTGTPVTDADRRSVEVHLANLRRKIGDPTTSPRWIRTVRGVGYRFDVRP